jgi:putative flavoprotein involved in K+ transport
VNGVARYDTVVIGAGQAGLAVGYHLARQGQAFLIVDRDGRVGDTWRRRWDSLRLFTPAGLDGLPGMRFPARRTSFPTKDEAADYLETYARRFSLPVRTRFCVDRVYRAADCYVVASGNTRLEAGNVVVATGAYRTPRIPGFAPDLDPAIVRLHSSEYRNPSQLRPGGVLVVGAGNSGAEIAIDVAGGGHPVLLSGRDTGQEAPFRPGSVPDRLLTPLTWLLFSRVLTTRTAAGRKLRTKASSMGWPLVRVRPADLAAAGIERVPRATGTSDGRPVLDGGRVMDVSTVIWCTGFRPDYDWIQLPVFGADGSPSHRRGVTSQDGLYFVGEFFLYSVTSSLLGGVGRDAEHIANHIASRPGLRS